MMSHWVNGENMLSEDVFRCLRNGLTVSLIATPRVKLMTCKVNDPVSEVVSKNADGYDFFPVTDDKNTQIIGLFLYPVRSSWTK